MIKQIVDFLNKYFNNERIFVDFWAPWCGSCKMLSNVLETIEDVKIGKVNVDENENVAKKYDILNLPTCILFQDGKEINRFSGYKNKEQIEQFITM